VAVKQFVDRVGARAVFDDAVRAGGGAGERLRHADMLLVRPPAPPPQSL